MYFFVRITPANVLYALWLSLRHPVSAWKIEVPGWLARRFGRVRPYRLFSRDEWLLAHDRAFDLWKTHAFPLLKQTQRHEIAVGGRTIDFSRNLWQLLGMEFEALCLFVAMVEKTSSLDVRPPQIVGPRITYAFDAPALQAFFPRVRIVSSAANRALENLHEWLIAAAHLGRQVAYLGMSLSGKTKRVSRGAVAWLGISPQEIPDRDDRLDFAWAAQYGHVATKDVIFFVPNDLTAAQRAYLDARGIEYVEPRDMFSLLDVDTRFRVIAASFNAFMSALARPAAVAPLLARLMARAPYWDAVFTELGTTTYVTTTSYSWPEKPELAVTSARGIRSIIWAYSANSLTFTVQDPTFRDVGVVRSILIANEFWVWNTAYAEWLMNRRVDAGGRPCEVRLAGPLMCGDSAWLTRDSGAARERLGLPRDGLCIGVFDMPPIADSWRDRFGGGPPMVDTDTYVAFWKIVERIVLQVPGSYALVKLKRDFTHAYREFPEFLRALVDEEGEHVKAGRVRRVDVNVDPYLPVAACDIAIGIAYTSPVLAARTAGKPGYYLDPLRRANFPSHPDYKLITLHTEEDAVNAVLRARDAPTAQPDSAPGVTPPPAVVPLAEPVAATPNVPGHMPMTPIQYSKPS